MIDLVNSLKIVIKKKIAEIKNEKDQLFFVKFLYGKEFFSNSFKRKSAIFLETVINKEKYTTETKIIENDNCYWANNLFYL